MSFIENKSNIFITDDINLKINHINDEQSMIEILTYTINLLNKVKKYYTYDKPLEADIHEQILEIANDEKTVVDDNHEQKIEVVIDEKHVENNISTKINDDYGAEMNDAELITYIIIQINWFNNRQIEKMLFPKYIVDRLNKIKNIISIN
jgi:hypothetical protein